MRRKQKQFLGWFNGENLKTTNGQSATNNGEMNNDIY